MPVRFNKSPLVIGVGQEWRGDDAAGLLVVRRLREMLGPRVVILESYGGAADLLAAWQGAAAVVLVDAVQGRGRAGEIYRFPVHERPLPAELSPTPSSHAWGLAQAAALGRVLNQLPEYLVVYGIEGRDFGLGQSISPEVARAVPETAGRIIQEIEAYLGRQTTEPT